MSYFVCWNLRHIFSFLQKTWKITRDDNMKVGKGAKWSTFNGSWKAFSLLRPEKMHRKTAFCSSPSFATLLLLLLVLHRISMSITIEKLTGISDAFFRTMSSSLLEILTVFFAYKMTQEFIKLLLWRVIAQYSTMPCRAITQSKQKIVTLRGEWFWGVENTLCLAMQKHDDKKECIDADFCVAGECAEGFQMGDEDSSCTPINQCLLNTSPCHSNATCNFLGPGTFQCICNQGFAGNGTHCYRKSILIQSIVTRYIKIVQLFSCMRSRLWKWRHLWWS